MSLKSKFKTSSALVQQGVWFDVDTNKDGSRARVKLRRHGRSNPHWVAAFRDKTADVDMENISPEEDEKLTADVFVEAVLVEWEHIQPDDDGNDLPFSKENALTLLSDPDWVDLLKDWQQKSNQLAAFQPKLEGDAKN